MGQISKIPADSPEAMSNLQAEIVSLDPADAFVRLDRAVQWSYKMREEAGRYLSGTLALVKQMWDDIPLEDRSNWSYDFYKYAKERTNGFTKKTIDNMVNVGRTFLLGPLPVSIPAEIVLYDSKGELTGKTVPADPWKQNISKLLIATGAAKDGRLEENPVALGQLFNPDVSVHTLRDTIRFGGELKQLDTPKSVLRLLTDGIQIIAVCGPDEVWVGELSTENHPLVTKAKEYIIAACDITRQSL